MNPEGGMSLLGLTITIVLLVGGLILLVFGIKRVLESTEGTTQVLWLLFVVFANPIGPIVALCALRSEKI